MLPAKTIDFYKQYMYKYFAYKQNYLMLLLNNEPLRKAILTQVDGGEDREFVTTLKFEVHFSYLHLVETLFEFIFAIDVSKEDDIWQSLADSKGAGNYPRIDKIAAGDFTELDRPVECELDDKLLTIPHVEYVFYRGFRFSEPPDEAFQRNTEMLRRILQEFANDFADRRAYNAFKHSFRLMQTMLEVNVGDQFHWDLSDSITFLPKNSKWEHIIENHDHLRDHRMAMLAYEMLTNIIVSRRAHYIENTIPGLLRWENIDFDKLSDRAIAMKSMKFSMTPVYGESGSS